MNGKGTTKKVQFYKAFILPLVVFAAFAIITGGRFSTGSSILSVLRTAVVPALLAMSLSFGMSMGMWNFAAGAIVYASAICSANFSSALGLGIPGVCLFSILTGIVLCAVMAGLYTWLRVPCLVLSLGYTMVVEALPSFFPSSTGKIKLLDGYLAGVPWCYVIVLVMFSIFFYINNYTVLGADMKAIGANIRIANNAGTDIDRVKAVSFLLSGLFLGVAGVIYISSNITVTGVTGFASSNMIFDGMMGVFLAHVLVKYINYDIAVIIGVLTIRMMGAGLVACGLNSEIRGILTGIFLFLVMAYSANAGMIEKARGRREIAARANARLGQ